MKKIEFQKNKLVLPLIAVLYAYGCADVAPVDAEIEQADASSIQSLSSGDDFAIAHVSVYLGVPSVVSSNTKQAHEWTTSGARVASVSSLSFGYYAVHFPGTAQGLPQGACGSGNCGLAYAQALGSDETICNATSWQRVTSPSDGLMVFVQCFNGNGDLVDNEFVLAWRRSTSQAGTAAAYARFDRSSNSVTSWWNSVSGIAPSVTVSGSAPAGDLEYAVSIPSGGSVWQYQGFIHVEGYGTETKFCVRNRTEYLSDRMNVYVRCFDRTGARRASSFTVTVGDPPGARPTSTSPYASEGVGPHWGWINSPFGAGTTPGATQNSVPYDCGSPYLTQCNATYNSVSSYGGSFNVSIRNLMDYNPGINWHYVHLPIVSAYYFDAQYCKPVGVGADGSSTYRAGVDCYYRNSSGAWVKTVNAYFNVAVVGGQYADGLVY